MSHDMKCPELDYDSVFVVLYDKKNIISSLVSMYYPYYVLFCTKNGTDHLFAAYW